MYRIVYLIYCLVFFLKKYKVPILPKLINIILLRLLFSCQISVGAKLGKNVIFSYGGLGTVINSGCEIGDNVKIGTNVLMGGRELEPGQVPIVGDNCIISTGAKLLGPITVGKNSVVGANSVVITDVPENSVVAGIPARIIKSNIKISDYRSDMS